MLGSVQINGFPYSLISHPNVIPGQKHNQLGVIDNAQPDMCMSLVRSTDHESDSWYNPNDPNRTPLYVQFYPIRTLTGVIGADVEVLLRLPMHDILTMSRVSQYFHQLVTQPAAKSGMTEHIGLHQRLLQRDYPQVDLTRYAQPYSFYIIYRHRYYDVHYFDHEAHRNDHAPHISRCVSAAWRALKHDDLDVVHVIRSQHGNEWFTLDLLFDGAIQTDSLAAMQWLIGENRDYLLNLLTVNKLTEVIEKQSCRVLKELVRSGLLPRHHVRSRVACTNISSITLKMARYIHSLDLRARELVSDDDVWLNMSESRMSKWIRLGYEPPLDQDYQVEVWDMLMRRQRYPSQDLIRTWLENSELDKLELLQQHMYPIHQLKIYAAYYTDRVRNWLKQFGIEAPEESYFDYHLSWDNYLDDLMDAEHYRRKFGSYPYDSD